MIITSNPEPLNQEFKNLIDSTVIELNNSAYNVGKDFSELNGNKLEPYIKDLMSDLAMGTNFEGSIELIGGQKFPDIIARRFFGIEVKTTTQNHWKTTGNSVFEGTRVDGVERIYMLFAKLASPTEFRWRPYEECLSEIVVTHSPRYLIDMNLEVGKTIFDKIKTPYDILRKQENPIKPIVDYYKTKLKPGEDLWWIEQEKSEPSGLIIKIWKNLSAREKEEIIVKGMIYFPELFSNRLDKFGKLSIWMVTREGVVCPNIRDLFTAGGKGEIIIGTNKYNNVPKIFLNLNYKADKIKKEIEKISAFELSEYWGHNVNESNKLIIWASLVSNFLSNIPDSKHLNFEKMLFQVLNF